MCTDPKGKSSSKGKMEHLRDTRLCTLHMVQKPFRVQIVGPETQNADGEARQCVRLLADEKETLQMAKSTPIGAKITNEIIVPSKCLIPPITPQENGIHKSTRKILSESYHQVPVANVAPNDILAWVPQTQKRTALIPCVLYFTGVQSPFPDGVYAFVCPLNPVATCTLDYHDGPKMEYINGWGYVYRVPIEDVFRWDNINEVRRRVAAELKFEKVETTCIGNGECTEFVYSKVATATTKDERMDDDDDSSTTDQATDMATNSPLVHQKLDENTSKGLYNSFEQENGNDGAISKKSLAPASESGNKRDGESSLNSINNSSGKNEDDLNTIPSGVVSKNKQQYSKSSKSYKDVTSSHAMTHRSAKRQLSNEKSSEIVVYGKCFANQENFEKTQHDEVEFGDMVVARPKYQDDIMGKVGLICKLPNIEKEEVFVGVKFEENIKVEPFEIRHVWGNFCKEENCHVNPKHVIIPVEFLISPDSPKALCLIKSKNKDKDNNEQTVASQIKVDYSYEANRRDFIDAPLDYKQVARNLQNFGIQSKQNSCYADAVMFAMFAFTNKFDEGLKRPDGQEAKGNDKIVKIKAARNMLKYDIVTALRSASQVQWRYVYKLRLALAKILGDKSILGNFMDAETFIVSLFSTVLDVPEFYEIGEDTRDYVLQLFPPMVAEGESRVEHPSVQYLLEQYCEWAEIKFRHVPDPGFIIKLPVSDGVPEFKQVYPNLTLNLGKLVENAETGKDTLMLRSVICLEKNHFTCFVRIPGNNKNESTHWIFHDSMATEVGKPIVTECHLLELALELFPCLQDPSLEIDKSTLSEETKGWLDKLQQTAYMCIYEPAYLSTNL